MPKAHPVAERLQRGAEAALGGWLGPSLRLHRPGWRTPDRVSGKVLVKESRKGSKTPTGWPPGRE